MIRHSRKDLVEDFKCGRRGKEDAIGEIIEIIEKEIRNYYLILVHQIVSV
jgi:hypothetical protein